MILKTEQAIPSSINVCHLQPLTAQDNGNIAKMIRDDIHSTR